MAASFARTRRNVLPDRRRSRRSSPSSWWLIFSISARASLVRSRCDVLHAPIFYTVCLLSSSLTIHFAVRRLAAGEMAAFGRWWLLTILLGGVFLFGTAREWVHLIHDEGLTISTNLFGTTYYSLVGLHAFHVTMGLLALTIVARVLFHRRGSGASTPSGWRSCRCTGTSSMRFGWWSSRWFT